MFIKVKYGERQELLFNPNCSITNLLESIKRRCKCDVDAIVDLSDESGNLKYLSERGPEYASRYLKERESFVLIRVEKKDGEDTPTYTPLLNDIGLVNGSFLERLAKPGGGSRSASRGSLGSRQGRSRKQSWARAKGVLALSGGKNRKSALSKGPKLERSPTKQLGFTV